MEVKITSEIHLILQIGTEMVEKYEQLIDEYFALTREIGEQHEFGACLDNQIDEFNLLAESACQEQISEMMAELKEQYINYQNNVEREDTNE